MSDWRKKVKWYRNKAAEYRELAEALDVKVERDFWMNVADQHDAIADNWDRNNNPNRK